MEKEPKFLSTDTFLGLAMGMGLSTLAFLYVLSSVIDTMSERQSSDLNPNSIVLDCPVSP